MEEDIKDLSLRVYDTLEKIGASEEMRRVHNENVIFDLIQGWCFSLMDNEPYSLYTCGSWCEGTTTPRMESDEDTLIVVDGMPVNEDINQAGYGKSLLMVQDAHTHPGYCKLQIVQDRVPLTVYMMDVPPGYELDRICIKHNVMQGQERHGPANTADVGGGLMLDIVTAFRCPRIPVRYTEWIHRRRHYGWPSVQLLDKMAKMSCLLVGVGHERSRDREIEWRVSFSLQERELMLSLNPTQHKCYVLMKMIKKDFIKPFLGGLDVISSYHCKTCLFYAVENSQPEIWSPENLVPCLLRCLQTLFDAVLRSNCPNYFISDSNMLDRIIFRQNRETVLRSLREVLCLGHRVLYRIKTDHFSELLQVRMVCDRTFTNKHTYRLELRIMGTLLSFNPVVTFRLHSYNTAEQNIQFLLQLLNFLQSTVRVQNYTARQTQEAVSYCLPWVYQRIAVSLASLGLGTKHNRNTKMLLLRSDDFFRRGLATDLMNTRLMYVAVLYKLGKNEMCREILEKLDVEFTRCVVSVCVCNMDEIFCMNVHLANKIGDKNLSVKDVLYADVASCIRFLPSDINIIPPPLVYEMHRSVNTSPGSRDEVEERWFDWVVVDAKVFLFFMQYLVFSKLELKANKEVAVENLTWVMSTDINHPETAYNLLGWIHFQEYRLEAALRCWRTSLAKRPEHNAAKWHITVLQNNIQEALNG